MKNRIGRTVGAALGAVVYVIFFATIAERFANPVSAQVRTDLTITVTAP